MSSRTFIASMVLLLTAAACTPADTDATSTTDGTNTTTTVLADTTTSTAPGDTSTTSTTVVDNDRALEIVGCSDASVEVAIVCEAYDLVFEQYVDDVDPTVLADAANRGLETLDGADSDELLVCATPNETFTSVCNAATSRADNSAEAAEAMVAGIAAYGLDAYSAYLDEDALELLQEEQEGEIQGIGALVSPEDQTIPGDNQQCSLVSETCQVVIVSTITGAPAEAAGLMPDDVLVAVDDQSIIGWTIDEVTSAVRGEAGTHVTLTIERGDEQLDLSIIRAPVVIPVIETATYGNVGYVGLANFSGNAGSQFAEAVVDRLSDGVDELVIDLRNNPGGFLTTAIDVTSVFLEDGDVIVTQSPDDETTYPVEGNAIVPDDMAVYLVVNRGSASASEVVAATLQERGRALIVGENTFGKNTVQQRFSLSNEGALKLTIARWLTPGGHDFGGGGVAPDIELDVAGLTPEELVAAVSASQT